MNLWVSEIPQVNAIMKWKETRGRKLLGLHKIVQTED